MSRQGTRTLSGTQADMLTAIRDHRVWRSDIGTWVVRGPVDGRYSTPSEGDAISSLFELGLAKIGESNVAVLLTDAGEQMYPVLRAGPEDDEEDPNEGLGDDLG